MFDVAVWNHFGLCCQGDQLLASSTWEALGKPEEVTITLGSFAEQTPETEAQTREFLRGAEQVGTDGDQAIRGSGSWVGSRDLGIGRPTKGASCF